MPLSQNSPPRKAAQYPFTPKRSSDHREPERLVVGLRDEYPEGFVDPAHRHRRAQLLYARSGVMSVVTEQCSYAVPPQRALLLQAGVLHEVSCRNDVSLRTLYIEPEVCSSSTHGSRLVDVSPLLRALIIEVVDFDITRAMDERQRLIVALLLHEIREMPDAPYRVPLPRDERLRKACRLVAENPELHADLDELAQLACMSRRAFTRLFRQETDTSFGEWRRQLRLVQALSLLESGQSITRTAYEVGYGSPSAFSAAFRRAFGISPSDYRTPSDTPD